MNRVPAVQANGLALRDISRCSPSAGVEGGTISSNSNKGVFETMGVDAKFITRFVTTLDRADRLLLMLFYAEQLSMSEISLVLDQPEFRIADRLKLIQQRTREALSKFAIA